jgi:hypothetical protein
MVAGETSLEMERRHVLEGEQRIIRLELIATEWRWRGHTEAEERTRAILVGFRETLRLSREQVQRLEHKTSRP